jgi:hypothetical protein
MLVKLITGSQTGVNRAVLDVALARGFHYGGWCPKGRQTEDGILNKKKYALLEAKSHEERIATELNIIEGDGVLVLTRGRPTGCTAISVVVAKRRAKPLLVIDLLEVLNNETAIEMILNWIKENRIEILTVTGPRESRCRGIYKEAMLIIDILLASI